MAQESEVDDAASRAYNQRVGERLRSIRKQKKMSLQELESVSNEEFKASVVGAYERGERSVSLPRLHRLAEIYNVPTEQLLPRDSIGGVDGSAPRRKMAVDLVALAAKKGAAGPELMESLARMLVLEYKERSLREAEKLDSRLAVPSVLFFFLPFLFLILTPLLMPVLDLL